MNSDPIRDPLEVELLLPPLKRRITVRDHERFRETLDDPHRDDDDITDLLTELREIERPHRRQ